MHRSRETRTTGRYVKYGGKMKFPIESRDLDVAETPEKRTTSVTAVKFPRDEWLQDPDAIPDEIA